MWGEEGEVNVILQQIKDNNFVGIGGGNAF